MRKIISFIVGLCIFLFASISAKIQIATGVMILPKIYFLEKLLPQYRLGYIITGFLIIFAAGFIVSWIDKRFSFLKILLIVVVTQVLAWSGIFNTTGEIDWRRAILYLVLLPVYAGLGGLLYKKISEKRDETNL